MTNQNVINHYSNGSSATAALAARATTIPQPATKPPAVPTREAAGNVPAHDVGGVPRDVVEA